ncbi:class I SAM-dependent methyltransferase [Pseudomonas sp. TCU-HL1]|uniref:class I SAM-dependent methyltransferase n=1 Tax=Pseudomonas sp. TCU-HL1 TaxID=1856685 RepID=UPI00083DE2AB|nr:methyltransferase type 12 [Pseudomonas sp. TCU-HL1]AOE86577.1 methyltransferase type 12 [Pseudomonas sp. TCU-HL1]
MPGYQVKYQDISIGDMDFHIRSLLDLQQYHDPERVAERLGISPESWPLFGKVWPSSQVLAHAMLTMDLQGKRVLELGAGLGLASLVVHRRGGDITASDYHPLSPAFLDENLRLNDLGPIKYQFADWSVLDDDLGVFDLIIGSDVIYEHGQPAVLATFIDRHSADLVEVLIVDPNRPNRASFCREMAELEYEGSRSRADCTLGNGDAYKGSLLHFQRNEARFNQ